MNVIFSVRRMDCGFIFHLFIFLLQLSLCLSLSLPWGMYFLLSIHLSVLPSAILPPAYLFRNVKWNSLALLTFIKCLHSKQGFWKWLPMRRRQGGVSVSVQFSVPFSCDMNALADGGGKQNEGGKRSYKLKTLILILEASSRRVWQWSSAPASTVCVTRTLSTSALCSNF